MTRIALLLLCFLTACGYSHVGEARGVFHKTEKTLTLRVERHVDTVISGPDVEEDQQLTLELTAYKVGIRWPVPSPNAMARFHVTRFGPSSEGTECTGYILIKSISGKTIVADLHLDITAHTANGSYTQQVKYRGEHTFYNRVAIDD